jgi:anti-sigma-K factor RskA
MQAQHGEHGDAGEHGEAVAYVLGALDPGERARFEYHAAACRECTRELEELRPVADRLALAVPQRAPPAHLAAHLLARAQALAPTIQRPPAVRAASGGPGAQDTHADHVGAGSPTGARRPRALDAPVPSAAPARRPWWPAGQGPATAIALVSLLVAAASGGYALTAHQQLQDTAQLAETLAIMYQPGMVARTLTGTEVTPAAKGRVFLVPDGTKAVLMTYDLPRLAKNEAYQCWLVNQEGERRVDGGVFTVDDKGRGHWIIRAPMVLSHFRSLGVTKEPARGSPGPTGPRVLAGQL